MYYFSINNSPLTLECQQQGIESAQNSDFQLSGSEHFLQYLQFDANGNLIVSQLTGLFLLNKPKLHQNSSILDNVTSISPVVENGNYIVQYLNIEIDEYTFRTFGFIDHSIQIGIHKKKTDFEENDQNILFTELRVGFETNLYEDVDEFGITYHRLSLEEPLELYFVKSDYGFCLKKITYRFQETCVDQKKIEYKKETNCYFQSQGNQNCTNKNIQSFSIVTIEMLKEQQKQNVDDELFLIQTPSVKMQLDEQQLQQCLQTQTLQRENQIRKQNYYSRQQQHKQKEENKEEYVDEENETDNEAREKYDSKNIKEFFCLHRKESCQFPTNTNCSNCSSECNGKSTKISIKKISTTKNRQKIKYINWNTSSENKHSFHQTHLSLIERMKLLKL